ncbi:MAG: DUF3604 domain-containing protein [Halioglobus sp.]
MKRYRGICQVGLLTFTLSGCGLKLDLSTDPWAPLPRAAEKKTPSQREECSHFVAERQPLFGDLHIHTSLSMDARSLGSRTLPDDVYAFATGKEIDVFSGDPTVGTRKAKIDRPLDFAAVTDHAEWLAEVSLCTTPDSASYNSKGCAIYRGEEKSFIAKLLGLSGFRARLPGVIGISGRQDDVCGKNDEICRAQLATVWQGIQAATERWYDRSANCSFSTFHGWEYSHSPKSTKIHRNIILRNDIVPELPISALETPTEMDLRRQLLQQCNDSGSGCDAIAIPHNPNLSNGQMFKVEYAELPLERQREEAALRARLEPIVEMMQIKGESECRNGMYNVIGGEDELCDFEKTRDFGVATIEDCQDGAGWGAHAAKGCVSRNDYVRYALLEGLSEKQRIGVNPYAFGFIGSTDTHMAAAGAVSEYDRPYGYGLPKKKLLTIGENKRSPAFTNPGGLAGVWAEENSRDSIFDALKRRETFATSGPRIAPRFFGGWNIPDDICDNPDMAAEGYRTGVPMGGVLLANRESQTAPSFVVSASADAGTSDSPGLPLQRLQVIKGWLGKGGEYHQQVVDVAGDANNGADVDPATCEPRGSGFSTLCGVWKDPAFDPNEDAVYYARVVENPSCRWTARMCLSLPEEERPDGCSNERLPRTVQERAWTAPIWYGAD